MAIESATPNAVQTATDTYDSKAGKYQDAVESIPQAQRTQESTLPKAPDPSPFNLGPTTPGTR